MVESAYGVGRHNSTGVDERRKCRILLVIKRQGAYRNVEGGEEPTMWPRIWVTTINRREQDKKGEDRK